MTLARLVALKIGEVMNRVILKVNVIFPRKSGHNEELVTA